MQFFPTSMNIFSDTPAGQSLPAQAARNLTQGGESAFQDIFKNLTAFNENNTPGLPAGFRSVRDDNSKIRSNDLLALRESLLERQVKENVLDDFTELTNALSAGPTLGNLMGIVSLLDGRQSRPLSEQESLAFSALLGKLGFNQEEVNELEHFSLEGQGGKLLRAVREKISSEGISLSKEEAALLCRAADFSAGAEETALALFGDQTDLFIDAQGFDRLFGRGLAELQSRSAEVAGLRAAMPEAMNEMLARRALEPEAPNADNRSHRQAERTKILAAELALSEEEDEESGGAAGRILRSRARAEKLLDQTKRAGENPEAAEAINAQSTAKKGANPALTSPPPGEKETPESSQRQTPLEQERSPLRAPREAGQDGRDAGGREGRNGLEEAGGRAALAARLERLENAFAGLPPAAPANETADAPKIKTAQYQEQIFAQVEKGLVRSLSDGAKQMVLRLDPPELGKLTLTLTLAQGEVKAVIRTENPEVTQALGEQLAQMKAGLEEQGFKVSSLEVETRAQSHAGTEHWNGAEQHNQQRELNARADLLRLARIQARESEELARTMQDTEEPASISASGLHLIA
jgi:flagellar hook-length control protein FliK